MSDLRSKNEITVRISTFSPLFEKQRQHEEVENRLSGEHNAKRPKRCRKSLKKLQPEAQTCLDKRDRALDITGRVGWTVCKQKFFFRFRLKLKSGKAYCCGDVELKDHFVRSDKIFSKIFSEIFSFKVLTDRFLNCILITKNELNEKSANETSSKYTAIIIQAEETIKSNEVIVTAPIPRVTLQTTDSVKLRIHIVRTTYRIYNANNNTHDAYNVSVKHTVTSIGKSKIHLSSKTYMSPFTASRHCTTPGGDVTGRKQGSGDRGKQGTREGCLGRVRIQKDNRLQNKTAHTGAEKWHLLTDRRLTLDSSLLRMRDFCLRVNPTFYSDYFSECVHRNDVTNNEHLKLHQGKRVKGSFRCLNHLVCHCCLSLDLHKQLVSGTALISACSKKSDSSSKICHVSSSVKNAISCLGLPWPPQRNERSLNNLFSVLFFLECFVLWERFIRIEPRAKAEWPDPYSYRKNLYKKFESCCDGYRKRYELLLRSGDVELNPGPELNKRKVSLVTQNCRGLNNHRKLKVIMNNCYKMMNENSLTIVALQETHLTDPKSILFQWRGVLVTTNAADSRSCGCATLFNDQTIVIETLHFGNRGHIAVVRGAIGNELTIIGNIYAPVRDQSQAQPTFYKDLYEALGQLMEKHEAERVILMGDFNINFHVSFVDNKYTKGQKQTAAYIRGQNAKYGLYSVKENMNSYKNVGNNSQSQIDNILINKLNDSQEKYVAETDWTFVNSDHAAIKCSILSNTRKKCNINKAPRLKAEWLKNTSIYNYIKDGLERAIETIPSHWDASMKLEFAKVSLRGLTIDKVKEVRLEWNRQIDNIKEKLNNLMSINTNQLPLSIAHEVNAEIEKTLNERNAFLECKGQFLADQTRSRWFNEGEKGTRYFLRLMESRRAVLEMEALEIEGKKVRNQDDIAKEVKAFYTNLYNNQKVVEIEDNIFENTEKCTSDEAAFLLKELTELELENTLKSTQDSTPGPDGIPYSYYRAYWGLLGPLLVQVYNESIKKGIFTPSQRVSYLRLLPKEGKDKNFLKNWRPITLSNCDYKLYTKTLAARLVKLMMSKLHPNQTAYLKGKQIQDNIRIASLAAKYCEGLIIMLDAQKAFDSLSHEFIKRTLMAYGLRSFIPTFEALYRSQRVDIMLNEDIITGYTIMNGVKQGDCLSCILFIMCIDPIIRKIESNEKIQRLEIDGVPMPKVLAYADDVIIMVPDKESARLAFLDYGTFSKGSGLILNAEKTEILKLGGFKLDNGLGFKYLDVDYVVGGSDIAKVNGIWISTQRQLMMDTNISDLTRKIKQQLNLWSTKGLTLLGRIQIYKTFGMTQLLYHGAVIPFNKEDKKNLNDIFNSYIWKKPLDRKNPRARIKKTSLQAPIEQGGFGMISFEEVLQSIRIRQFFKLADESFNHPLKSLILNGEGGLQSGYGTRLKVDELTEDTKKFLKVETLIKYKGMDEDALIYNSDRRRIFGQIKLIDVTKPAMIGKDVWNFVTHVLHFSNLMDIINEGRAHKSKVKRLLKLQWKHKVIKLWEENAYVEAVDGSEAECFELQNNKFKKLAALTSKQIRINLFKKDYVAPNKVIEEVEKLTQMEYFLKIKKLRSIRHKNLALRCWSGDILSNNRLYQMGLVESDKCETCGELETRLHLVRDCQRAKKVWDLIIQNTKEEKRGDPNHFWLGLNDSLEALELKIECLHNLILKRTKTAQEIFETSISFIESVKGLQKNGFGDINIDRLLQ